MIWFDVSDTMASTRAISGIVRTQIELCSGLVGALGDGITLCVFRQGRFVPVARSRYIAKVLALQGGEFGTDGGKPETLVESLMVVYGTILRHGPSFARPILRSLVQAAKLAIRPLRAAGRGRLGWTMHDVRANATEMAPSDVFVSVGLVWVPASRSASIAKLRRRGIRTILCCYDLIPLLLPHLCLRDEVSPSTNDIAALCSAADTILCISECTRHDLERVVAGLGIPRPRIKTFYLGSNYANNMSEIGTIVSHIDREFILFVSTIERRKNHVTLYKAYVTIREHYRKQPPLCIFAGAQGWGVAETLSAIARDPRVNGDFLHLHHVGDSDLNWLYEHCLFTVFPSLYEGWGLPVAESLNRGKFVIASGSSSLMEVGGRFAEYIDPWDVGGWAHSIMTYYEDRAMLGERETDIRQQYRPVTWQESVEAVRQEIEMVMATEG